MNELVSKISSYHLFNYLLPGCLFAVLATTISHRQFVEQNVVLGLFLYYFYGLIVSRFGSLLLQPFLKLVRFLRFAPYADFVAASKKDPKIDELSEINNMYRTLCALFLVLLLLKCTVMLEVQFPRLTPWERPSIAIVIFGLLLFSYRTQTAYIRARVKANTETTAGSISAEM
ncbi:MAG TPA: hypothetical protein VKR52_05105 [Terracidiphilus sp.]|nr:hypothetical protein [Terracidiphilus sp.]